MPKVEYVGDKWVSDYTRIDTLYVGDRWISANKDCITKIEDNHVWIGNQEYIRDPYINLMETNDSFGIYNLPLGLQ